MSRPYAHKWREIGYGLGFTADEMASIESSPQLFANAPASLDYMLSLWYQWVPGDARGSTTYATMNSLRKAVDRASLGVTARELGG